MASNGAQEEIDLYGEQRNAYEGTDFDMNRDPRNPQELNEV